MRCSMSSVGFVMFLVAASIGSADDPSHEYFTTSDGIKIHYMQLGDEGSYVVLIHGYTGSAEGNWFRNGIAEALARNHRVVAIDCRNHGRSDKPQQFGGGCREVESRLILELPRFLGPAGFPCKRLGTPGRGWNAPFVPGRTAP